VRRTRGRNRKGRREPRAFGIINAGDQIVKRMTFSGLTLATGAGTVVAVTQYNSGEVQALPATEWASFAARYQQYRVRAIRVTGKAVQPVQSATISHAALYRGDFIGSATPASAAQVLSDERVKTCGTDRDFTDVVTWRKNPNARLWVTTTTAIPAANQYAWVCASPVTPALTTATTYYAIVVEWEVEFRGSQ